MLVTVAGVTGSAPRELGAKMLVTRTDTIGTIGGGQLEYKCARLAFDRLGSKSAPALRKFPLGASFGQCCGGVVDILFETLDARAHDWIRDLNCLYRERRPAVMCTALGPGAEKFVLAADAEDGVPRNVLRQLRSVRERGERAWRQDGWLYEVIRDSELTVAVFGAGHVGSALVRILSSLDFGIRWVDSRRNIFEPVAANVHAIETPDPSAEVDAMPAGGIYFVLTHSHALDFDICSRILLRGDAAYCGLIGSRSKRRRFEKRFRAQGIPEPAIASLVCPIGIPGISGKKPAEIAVAAAAEVLKVAEKLRQRGVAGYADNVRVLENKQ